MTQSDDSCGFLFYCVGCIAFPALLGLGIYLNLETDYDFAAGACIWFGIFLTGYLALRILIFRIICDYLLAYKEPERV